MPKIHAIDRAVSFGAPFQDIDADPHSQSSLRQFTHGAKTWVRARFKNIIENAENTEAIEAGLQDLTEGRYLSPRKLDHLLRGLPGVNASLPEAEIRRLEDLLPQRLSPEAISRIKMLRESTMGDLPPYIQQIPAKFVVDGVERDFTLASLEGVWNRARLADDNPDGEFSIYVGHEQQIGNEIVTRPKWTRTNMLGLYETKFMSEKIRGRVFTDGMLRAYSAGCLKGSQNLWYPDQLRYQRAMMGTGGEIGADAFFALLFRNLGSGTREGLMMNGSRVRLDKTTDIWMRLNEASDNGPYFISSSDGFLYMKDCFGDAGGHGIGASIEIY